MRTYITILGLMLMGLVANAQEAALDKMPCDLENTTWAVGEKLTYKVYYNWEFIWISAGEVTFEIKDAGDYYDMICIGKTFKSYDTFFKVSDKYYTRVSKETLQPQYFVRDVHQDSYIKYDSLYFNYDKNIIEEYFGETKETAEYFEFPLDDCVQDMVSIMYYLRNYPQEYLNEGSKLPISVFFDKEYFNLNVGVEDVQKKRIKGRGKQEVIKIIPQIVTGDVFKKGDEMQIYVSNDESKIPLMIESAIRVGSVKVILQNHENTKG